MSCSDELRSLREDYLALRTKDGKEMDNELILILKMAEERSHLENISSFELEYNGNKRNSDNQIYRRRLNDEDAIMFYRLLKDNNFVVGLHLAYNNIGDEGANAISSLLQDTPVLKYLTLSFNDFGPKGAEAIAKGIQMNETLRVLRLDGNKIGRTGGMFIAGALQVNAVLEELDLAHTDLTTDCIIAFATVLTNHPSIKRINLNRPLLFSHQEETTVHISHMLKVNKTLESLHIGKHGMVNFGAERLAEKLWHNRSLLHLDLNGNRISRDGALHLANLLKHDTPLRVLNLAYNRIEDEGASYIAEALVRGNTNLRVLAICYNEIAEKGLCDLAKALDKNITLQQIYIWGNTFTTPICKAFQDLLESKVPRLSKENTDVRPYVVDGIPYLARIETPYAV